ncbi:hypothetical protein DIKCMJMK_04234 [Shewanella oneidensis]|nr:hypothetical protein [Shewanella oneidensis]
MPIADNATKDVRAKNLRIGIIVSTTTLLYES